MAMRIQKIFWDGLKVFIPLVVTFTIVFWIIQTIESFFGHFLKSWFPNLYFKGLGILVGFALIIVLGAFVNAWMIKHVYRLIDKLVKRIPLIKTIYNAIQELVDFFDNDKGIKNQKAVMIETPLGKMIGFITRDSITDLPFADKDSDEVLVYLPLSYQVGGMMLAIPRDQIVMLNWPVDTVMSFVLTAGMSKAPRTPKASEALK